MRPGEMRNRAAARASSCSWVYFIGGGGHVKIGATQKPPRFRLQALALSGPVPLDLLAVVPDQTREQEFHDRFRASHSHGEWFRLTADIQAFIDEVRCDLDPYFGIPVVALRQAMSDLMAEEMVA